MTTCDSIKRILINNEYLRVVNSLNEMITKYKFITNLIYIYGRKSLL